MFKRILSSVIALIIALSLGIQTPFSVIAETIPHYLKDIQMVTASSKDEAVAKLKENGYTVLDQNLRDGISGDVCYLGYKTTTNESEAICDIRLMNAKGGINEKKYRDLVTQWKSGIETSAQYLKEASLDVKNNYQKGSPLAEAAVAILDIFEVDGVKLSDYLFNENRKDSEYQDIILICADNVVSTIYSALNLGTADYGSSTFAKRLEKTNFSDYDYSKIILAGNDGDLAQLWDKSARILTQLQNFNMDYDDALYFFYEYEFNEDQNGDDSEDIVIEDYWKNFVDDKYKNSTDVEEQELYKYANVIGLYEKLSKYSIPNSKYENLAAYIYDCGNPFDEDGNESDNITYRLYPLVSALTDGQIFTLQYGGVSALVSALDANTEENKNNALSAVDEIKNKIKDNGFERISVFFNVNREIYDQTIAFTNEAERVATASSSYDKLVQEEVDDEVTRNLNNIVLIGGMVAGSVLVVAVLTLGITAAIAGTTMATLVDVGILAILSGSIGVASGGMTLTAGAIITGLVGTVLIIVALVILAVIIVCLLISLFRKLFSKDEKEEEVLPSIPNIIYDVNGSDFTKYDAVLNQNGSPVDLTCGNGKEWDVMYVSYSNKTGSPIKASANVFKVQTNSSTIPDGYTPVSRFGYIDTANLKSFQPNSKAPLYIFYQGQSREGDSKQKYVSDIMLSQEDTAEAARLGIIKAGYTPIEQNLTPNTGKTSYIGYVTTSNVNDAITDIRIAYYYSAKSFLYGNKSDGSSVEYAFVGELVTKASIYYTRQKSNGSAIIADFKFTSSKLDADSGYEPVILFSGGDGYNFMIGCNDFNGIRAMDEDNWNQALYMYFKPSVTFSSSDTEYISGFAFSSGYKNNLNFAAQNGFKIVESLGEHNLSKGTSDCPTYILYSTTHNPYRAITEISTFNPSNSAESLFENITVGGVGYAVCETFACVIDEGFFTDDYYRILRPSNGYITRLAYEGASDDINVESKYAAINNFGKYENIPLKGLYVAGPCSTKEPLTIHDINFCTEKDTAGRTAFVNDLGETVFCKPVNDLTECYSTVADNLTFEWDYEVETGYPIYNEHYYAKNIVFSNYLRIFVRGEVEKRGKYISNIRVATFDPEKDNDKKYTYDQAMVKLLSYGEGEIIKINLCRSSQAQPVKTESSTDSYGTITERKIYENYVGPSTYIMVQYTDYQMDSIRTATTKWYGDSDVTPDKKLDYQKVKFDSAGDMIKGVSGNYALYTSKNGQLGSLVTDLIIDSDYLKADCSTVVDCLGNYNTNEDYIFKLKRRTDVTNQSYIKDIKVSTKSSRQECIKDLYKNGCTAFIDQNKNENLGGNYIYIGYSTTLDETDSSVVRGVEIKAYSSSTHDTTYKDDNGYEYYAISDDLNKGVGGSYTYLYVTNSKDAAPLTYLTTSTIMSSTLTKYKDYKTHDWVTTNNAADGTKGTYKLCYRQKNNYWTIDSYGTLILSLNGNMNNYTEKMLIFYTRPGATGARRETISYLPEWCEYGDAINEVSIYSSVKSIDDCAFKNCPNIKMITITSKDCVIQEGAIPDGVIIRSFYGSTAYEYAEAHNLEFKALPYINGTIIGNSNFIVIVSISVVLIGCGIAAICIKKKKKKSLKCNEENGNEQ